MPQDSIDQVWRGMNRWFVNLIMHDLMSNIYSLYRMDIRHLFYETAEIAVQVQAAEEAKSKNKQNKLSMIESWKDVLNILATGNRRARSSTRRANICVTKNPIRMKQKKLHPTTNGVCL